MLSCLELFFSKDETIKIVTSIIASITSTILESNMWKI